MSRDPFLDAREALQQEGVQLQGPEPRKLSKRILLGRIQLMNRALDEFADGAGCKGRNGVQDLGSQAEALVRVVDEALRTAARMGLPWGALWDDRGRGHTDEILATVGYDPSKAEVG